MSPIAKQSINRTVAVAAKSTKVVAKDVSKKQMTSVQKFAAAAGAAYATNPIVTFAFTNTRTIPDDYQPVVTDSLKAFLNSCIYGGVVLGLFLGAVVFVSYLDPIRKTE